MEKWRPVSAPLLLKHKLFVVDETNDSVFVQAGMDARIPHGLYTRDEIQAFITWEQAKAAQPGRTLKQVESSGNTLIQR